ncbi:MAG TPA: hypothetical protein VJL87_04475 [Bdellovibrionota bacterium]|nr:hypothetical protein [Bdellovibrionota bacterium]
MGISIFLSYGFSPPSFAAPPPPPVDEDAKTEEMLEEIWRNGVAIEEGDETALGRAAGELIAARSSLLAQFEKEQLTPFILSAGEEEQVRKAFDLLKSISPLKDNANLNLSVNPMEFEIIEKVLVEMDGLRKKLLQRERGKIKLPIRAFTGIGLLSPLASVAARPSLPDRI